MAGDCRDRRESGPRGREAGAELAQVLARTRGSCSACRRTWSTLCVRQRGDRVLEALRREHRQPLCCASSIGTSRLTKRSPMPSPSCVAELVERLRQVERDAAHVFVDDLLAVSAGVLSPPVSLNICRTNMRGSVRSRLWMPLSTSRLTAGRAPSTAFDSACVSERDALQPLARRGGEVRRRDDAELVRDHHEAVPPAPVGLRQAAPADRLRAEVLHSAARRRRRERRSSRRRPTPRAGA